MIAPEKIRDWQYDGIFIMVEDFTSAEKIQAGLGDLGISDKKIVNVPLTSAYMDIYMDQRFYWIRDYANWVYETKMNGNVAECGVYRGDSAKFINRFFYDKKLYLFDTFEGFPERDLTYEKCLGNQDFNNGRFAKEINFINTDINSMLKKMIHPENICIRRGYFPESAKDVKDRFCFVNLDMDLYLPMLNGLRYFWRCLEKNGCILMHDYFRDDLPGVKQAVRTFEEEIKMEIPKFPIGDGCSIALLKNI